MADSRRLHAKSLHELTSRPRMASDTVMKVASPNSQDRTPAEPKLGVTDWALISVFYSAVSLVATYPAVLTARTKVPNCGLADIVHGLWIMRWYKHCLFGARLPFLCPELQYPVGAPLGLFTPLHLQALLYLPLSLFTSNDVLIYNLLWLFGFIFTGMGTFVLAWRLTQNRAASALAGVLAMLSTPMFTHSNGQLELTYLGSFPLFLAAWLSFVDRPSAARLGLALLGNVVVAMSAAYFVVFTVFPAVLYVAWCTIRAWRLGERNWLRHRLGWLAAYAGLAGVALALVFICHLWAVVNGTPLAYSKVEFDRYPAALWGYLLPTWGHKLHNYLPFAPYPAAWGMTWAETAGERASYLGLVTIILLHQAVVRRVRFPRVGFFWTALVLLIVLSLGSSCQLGEHRVGLPSGWLREHFFAFRLIRVPARFNLFVAVIAAVLAGATFGQILGRFRSRAVQGVIFAGVTAIAIFDLSMPPAPTALPAQPACYRTILQRDPQASFLEVPHTTSACTLLSAMTGYWQSLHQGRTSGGYSGHANAELIRQLRFTSPFWDERLDDPAYLEQPEKQAIDLLGTTRFREYAWLYMTAHGFRYAVLHRWPGATPERPNLRIDRVQAQLNGAQVYEDAAAVVFDRDRLPEPAHPAIVCTEGWRHRLAWRQWHTCPVGPIARAVVFNPNPDRELTFALEAASFLRTRVVRVMTAGREFTRWTVSPEGPRMYLSPPFRLPRGLSELVIESDGAEEPRGRNVPPDGDRRPFSLRVTSVCLRPSLPNDPQTRADLDEVVRSSFPPERVQRWDVLRYGVKFMTVYRLKRETEPGSFESAPDLVQANLEARHRVSRVD